MCIDLYPTCLALRCGISALACIQLPELQVSFLLIEEFHLLPFIDDLKISLHEGIQLCKSTLFRFGVDICSP